MKSERNDHGRSERSDLRRIDWRRSERNGHGQMRIDEAKRSDGDTSNYDVERRRNYDGEWRSERINGMATLNR